MAQIEISAAQAVQLARLIAGDRKFSIAARRELLDVAERIMCTPAFAAALDAEGFETCDAPSVGEGEV